MYYLLQELEAERTKLMEDVASNKRKMKELEDNLLFRLTSTQVWTPDCENGDEWEINSVKIRLFLVLTRWCLKI